MLSAYQESVLHFREHRAQLRDTENIVLYALTKVGADPS